MEEQIHVYLVKTHILSIKLDVMLDLLVTMIKTLDQDVFLLYQYTSKQNKTINSIGEYILLLIHEAAHLAHSSITLLSEFQLHQYGLVIDSVSKRHVLSTNPFLYGTQRIYLPNKMEIDMSNRRGIMVIPQFDYMPGDDETLEIIEITSKEQWVPQRYCKEFRLTDND